MKEIKTTSDLLKNPAVLDKIIDFLNNSTGGIKDLVPNRNEKVLITETNHEGQYIDKELKLLEKLGLININWESIHLDNRPIGLRRYECKIDNSKINDLFNLATGGNSDYKLIGLKSVAQLISEFNDDDDILNFLVDSGVNEKIIIQLTGLQTPSWKIVLRILMIYTSTNEEADKKVIDSIIDKICEAEIIKGEPEKAKELKTKLSLILKNSKK